MSEYKRLRVTMLVVLLSIGSMFVFFLDEIGEFIKEYKFKEKLEKEYVLVDYKFITDDKVNYISFSGYKNMPCSMYLKTNVDGVDFSDYNIGTFQDNWKEVAYKFDGKLYIAKYIRKYTSKEDLMNYVSLCDNEIAKSIKEAKLTALKNKKSFEGIDSKNIQ